MQKTKLLRLLNSLDGTELKALSKFIHSDYFKVSKSSIKLFDSLLKHAPHFEEEEIDKEKLWKKIYPKKDFSLKLYTNKLSSLSIQVERFLVIQILESKEEKHHFRQLKAKALNSHNLYADFKKEIQQLLNEREKPTIEGMAAFRALAALNHQIYFQAKNHKVELKDFNFEKIWEGHQSLSLLGILIYTIESINRHQILGEPIGFIDNQLLNQLAQKNDNQPLIIQLYIQLYQLVTAKNHSLEQFDEVTDAIILHLNSVDYESKEILLVSLSNYLGKRIYEGATTFKSRVFKIYYALYQEGVFTQHGSLGENTFLNMINYGINYKGAAWTQQFMEEATPKLEISIRERVTQLGWVYYYFATKQYDDVLKNLVVQKGSNHLFKMRMHSLGVRTYYELALTDNTYYQILFSACTKFSHFLKNEPAFTEDKKRSYLNFLSILRTLAKHQQQQDYGIEERERIKRQIGDTPQMALKEWLMEKVLKF